MPMTRRCGISSKGFTTVRLALALAAAAALTAVASTAALAAPPVTSPSWGAGHVKPRLALEAMQASGDTGVPVIAYGHDARKALEHAGVKHVRKLDLIDGASGVIRADAMDTLLADEDVSYVAADAPVRLDGPSAPARSKLSIRRSTEPPERGRRASTGPAPASQ